MLINCDLGESFGYFKIGDDEQVMPLIDMCNIACGFHAGDPLTIRKTILLAKENGVLIGAHPSYPDLAGFGRRQLALTDDELAAITLYQVGALKTMVECEGEQLHHVKPHGALYNYLANNANAVSVFVKAIKSIDSNLAVIGLAASCFEKACKEEGIKFLPEAFIDRKYDSQGMLMSRANKDAVITDVNNAIEQLSQLKKGYVRSLYNKTVKINAETVCVHGDNSSVVQLLQAIRK